MGLKRLRKKLGILPPVSLAGLSNRLVITCLFFFLHQKAAVTLLLCSLASADIHEEAPPMRSGAGACPARKPRGHAAGRCAGRHLDYSPLAPAQGSISKPGGIADSSPKTPIAPCCAVPLLSAVSWLLPLFGSIVPSTLGAPALFAVEVVLA